MAHRILPAILTGSALALAGCSAPAGAPAASDSAGQGPAGQKVKVVAAFYPLAYAAERVGGEHVEVTNLITAGTEPHDYELTPKDQAKLTSAKLAIYEKGFQPAVDTALAQTSGAKAYDVSADADLTIEGSADGHDHGHEAEASAQPATASTPAADDHDHEHEGGSDPHFWLDPVRYGKVAQGIASQLAAADPANKAAYEANAKAFVGEMNALDQEFSTGLKSCTNRDLVTSHAAFAYLSERYKFTQKAISGVSPEQEPDAARLGEIASFVKANKVSTIYTETLASPAVAETIARETGAQTAVLDPIEGITDASAARDYPGVMRANLATLKKGQSCQ